MATESNIETLTTHWRALNEEVIWLHGRWKLYRQLYGTGPERIDLLNECAGSFFHVIQIVLMNDVQLTLSKLADRAETPQQRNLTLQTLVNDVAGLGETLQEEQVSKAYGSYRQNCAAVIRRRHKQLAHFDKATLLNDDTSPLPGPSRQEIEDCLRVLRHFMNAVAVLIGEPHVAYGSVIMGDDGDSLVYWLAQGRRYAAMVHEGAIAWDDFRSHSKYADLPSQISIDEESLE